MPEVNSTSDPASWLEKVPGEGLRFQTVGQRETTHLVPLYKVLDERYSVYWKMNAKSA
jgi:hypothetical protein